MLATIFARFLLVCAGDRLCGRIPDWTAHVGQPWDTYDRAPWNLYNLLWRLGQWAVARDAGRA